MAYGSNLNNEYMMERVNKRLKRRYRVAGDFSNEESPLMLVGFILMDVNEKW